MRLQRQKTTTTLSYYTSPIETPGDVAVVRMEGAGHEGCRERSGWLSGIFQASRHALANVAESQYRRLCSQMAQELKISRACEDIYHDQFCQRITEYATAIVLPKEIPVCLFVLSMAYNERLTNTQQDPLSGLQESLTLVIFRGTCSWMDVMHDLVCLPVPQKHGIPVHCGFNSAISKCLNSIFAKLKEITQSKRTNRQFCFQNYFDGLNIHVRVVFSGHSYGGGCAMILALISLLDADWQGGATLNSSVAEI
eukprot:768441-Hanusia_phi.AAC.5